jgi:NDP-sugar pyrophosphorylase family protein
MKIYVLAGGLGTRVSKVYPNIPKALIPVRGKPFLGWKIEQLRSQGFEQICLLLGHKAEQINEFVEQEGLQKGLTFVNDGKQLKGTGGAILKVLNPNEKRLILTFGDNLLPLDIKKFNQYCEDISGSVMTITSYCGPSDSPNVQILHDKISRYGKSKDEKFDYVDYGLFSFLTKDLMSLSVKTNPNAVVDLTTILQHLIDQRKLFGYLIDSPYFEIGTPKGIAATEQFLAESFLKH